MQDPANYASTYAGWDFATVWSAPSAGYYPQLYGVNYVLRVDPANASRVYGEANPAFTYSIYGFHAGDTAGIVTGLSVSTAATTTSNVGTYAISASGGSAVSVSGQAYRFIDAPGTLTVTPRAITVTADTQSRVYGNANPVLTYQVGGSGLVNGDTLSGALATPATSASNVGVYGITQGTLGSPNYTISSFTGANLTVTPRAITVTADAIGRAYGDANPVLTYQVGGSGLANGDTLSGALATSATSASNVGMYGITQGTLGSSNYTISSFTGANLTVTPRALTVTADARSRAYGDANPALTYQVGGSGLVNGDTLSGALATSATTASNVGVYGISQGSLAASSNYALNYTSANLTVTPRSLTVTADAQSRVYGDANPALTYQVGGSGLVNGDTLSGALATSATTAGNVGVYGITQGTLGLAELHDILFYRRQPDGHAARDHRDGRCHQPRLWRCQSGSDLSGRRLGPRQWRHAVGRAGDVGDRSQQCRYLRDHARNARGLIELRLHLCWRESHDYAGGPSSADRNTRILREGIRAGARATAVRAVARVRKYR